MHSSIRSPKPPLAVTDKKATSYPSTREFRAWLTTLLVLVLTLIPQSSEATIREVTFTGTVSGLSGGGNPFGMAPSLGDPISATFSFDVNAPGVAIAQGFKYTQSATSYSILIDGQTITPFSNNWQVVVTGNANFESFAFEHNSNGPGNIAVNGVEKPSGEFQFSLSDTASPYPFGGNFALPEVVPSLSKWTSKTAFIRDNNTGAQITITLTSIKQVNHVTFYGTVSGLSGGGNPFGMAPSLGDPISATFSYDVNAPGVAIAQGFKYTQSATSYSILIDGQTITPFSNNWQVVVAGNANFESFAFEHNSNGPGNIAVNGVEKPSGLFQFSLSDTVSPYPFGGNFALPDIIPSLSEWTSKTGFIRDNNTGAQINMTLASMNQSTGPSPQASIEKAVEVRWDSLTNCKYQVQSSADLKLWANFGDPIIGDGSIKSIFASTVGQDKKFFRVIPVR